MCFRCPLLSLGLLHSFTNFSSFVYPLNIVITGTPALFALAHTTSRCVLLLASTYHYQRIPSPITTFLQTQECK